ncbi:phage tail assembly protein T [Caballeronia sp. DA-9]|uniref:phage tail assembly protein T n=1 Tax=Caballeronia sp. DA-9 TaxID=3436237 RepID=UPI003F66C51B
MRDISSVEFTHWMAYYNIEPFGERIADVRMGMIASTMANIHRDPKQQAFEPSDFTPWAGKKRGAEPIVFEDPKDQARFVALALFGIDLAKSKGKKFTVKRRGGG